MSSRSLPKKFFHANSCKKAWKIFKATTIQTKLNISTTLKRTKKYCSSAFTFLRRYLNNIPRKLQYSSRRDSSLQSHHFQYYRQQKNQCKASFSAIYIDELFPGQNRDNMNYKEKAEKPLNGSRNSTIETGETSGGGGGCDSNGRKLSMFRGVDERAEEFITKIREEMKLEREKSIIDFQEMLARSS